MQGDDALHDTKNKKKSTINTKGKPLPYHSIMRFIKHCSVSAILLVLSALLFASAFPNPILRFGSAVLAFCALLPLALLIARISFIASFFWGFAYGATSYMLHNYWLSTFSPIAFVVVPFIYAMYFTILFPLMKILYKAFPKSWFVFQCCLWIAYEYLRTQGFLGYSFGILGYSLAFHPLLIQTADIFGVWILSIFVTFPSFVGAYLVLHARRVTISISEKKHTFKGRIARAVYAIFSCIRTKPYLKYALVSYAFLSAFILVYGYIAQRPFTMQKDSIPTVKIALLQHSKDPWQGGINSYSESLKRLTKLTHDVMNTHEKPDLVVWSETAFVPSIIYHKKYRQNTRYVRLIEKLFALFESYPKTEFIIGNGERLGPREKQARNLETEEASTYNAAHLFQGSTRKGVYYKNHLVPFTEYFPYKKIFPRFYNVLLESDVHFWLQGKELSLLEGKHASYATPICFEDGFGLQNAQFVKKGAQIIVNISNDAWSHVETNAMQHLQLSILRAVENKRSVVRSTNAGMTAAIDPNGHIISMLDSFTVASITEDISIYDTKITLYTRFGDWFALLMLLFSSLSILYALLLCMKKHKLFHPR